MTIRSLLVLLAAAVTAGCGGGDETREPGRTTATPPDPAAESPRLRPGRIRPTAREFTLEGWKTDFRRHSVPLDEFQSGGPTRDGIPAIDAPRFVSVDDADDFLDDREPVIELTAAGETRAYPLQILVWHEIVNDTVAGTPVAVTFCPLCYTALVFDRRVRGRTLDFGTTGKLRNSDLVMYDRQTESWWQQFGGDALVGRLTGARLRQLPARIVAWNDFAERHPDGRVLSRDTGFQRPYGENPYEGYDDVEEPPRFEVDNGDDDRLPPKERVVFVERGDDAVAVPFSALARRNLIRVTVGGRTLDVRWTGTLASALDAPVISDGRAVGAVDVTENGRRVAFDQPFWFAVAAFRPDVRIVR